MAAATFGCVPVVAVGCVFLSDLLVAFIVPSVHPTIDRSIPSSCVHSSSLTWVTNDVHQQQELSIESTHEPNDVTNDPVLRVSHLYVSPSIPFQSNQKDNRSCAGAVVVRCTRRRTGNQTPPNLSSTSEHSNSATLLHSTHRTYILRNQLIDPSIEMFLYPKMATLVRRIISTQPQQQQQPKQQPRLKTSTPRCRANSTGHSITPPDHHHHHPPSPLRARFNSRDRTFQQQQQTHVQKNDLIPLECFQQSQAVQHLSMTTVCCLYISLLFCLNIISTVLVASLWKNGSDEYFHTASWTVTCALHSLLHFAGVHWVKGAAVWTTTTGEMNGWTVWEQLELSPTTTTTAEEEEEDPWESEARLRRVLTILPLLLALAVCYIAKFEPQYCGVHVVLCAVHLVPKLSCMNGVRLFGINRTAGIDDE